MPDFENFIKTIKSGDYERALKKYKFDTDLRALEILKKYFASKNDLYLELYGIELGFDICEVGAILENYNDCECERCFKKYSSKEQTRGEVVCDECYEILSQNM